MAIKAIVPNPNIDRIKKIKEALITQKRLAYLTGINEVRLSRGLNNEFEFTKDELTKIAKALRIKL
jgi:transcriptional regulator with XRE-family HTH domain